MMTSGLFCRMVSYALTKSCGARTSTEVMATFKAFAAAAVSSKTCVGCGLAVQYLQTPSSEIGRHQAKAGEVGIGTSQVRDQACGERIATDKDDWRPLRCL